MKLRAALSFLMFLLLSPVMASDWPQFLGPARNGTSTEKIRTSWDKSEPVALWTKKVGAGFKEIATKYKGKADAEATLTAKLAAG